MESENKIISDVSEKTNSLSVVPDETMKSAEISAAKESEEKDVDKDRKKSRKESKDRSDRRSRDRRTSKAREEDRRRSSDRSRRHDREKEGDRERRDKEKEGDRERRDKDKEGDRERRDKDKDGKDKEGDKEKDKVREKDREKDSTRDRDRDRDSRRDRDRERDRDRDRGRSTRDRGRDSRDRERSRRSTSRTRRDRESRRRRSRSASPDDRHRNKSRRRSASPDKKGRDEAGDSSKPKPITLRDIIALNPGISVAEAAIRLNAYNTAVARGLTPESVTAPLQSAPGVPMGLAGSGAAPMMMAGGINPVMAAMMGEGGAATKPHRELYVGNLPPGITVPQIAEFMNAAFKQMGLAKDSTQNTVITAWVSPDGKFAFVELRSIEDATAALAHLNGIQVGAYSLRIGRPKGYSATGLPGASAVAVPMQTSLPSFNNPLLTSSVMGAAPGLGNSNPLLAGLNSSLGLGMPAEAMSNAIMVTNLPALISEAQIRELFTPFGELRAFNVIKTPSGSTQSAVLEYVNPALTEGVIGGMNGLDIADHKLSVLRIPASSAAVLLQPTSAPPPPAGPPPLPVSAPPAPDAVDELSACDPTTVIRLSNMTTPQDLADDQSFEELMEDVADECNSHGTVKSIVIPRTGSDSSVGKIFVHFVDIAGAQATRKAVAGRKFNGRVVEAYFYPEALFLQKVYCLPAGYLAGENSSSEATGGNDKPHTSQNGSSRSAGDINDIDEDENHHTSTTVAAAEGVYDPSAVMEDLD